MDLDQVVMDLELQIAKSLNPDLFELDQMDASHLGRKITQARKKASLTQVELAKKLKLTQGQLSRIESGKRPASQELIRKIAGICSQEYDWFFA